MNTSFDIYEMITNLIIERLEAGVVPWQMHWKAETGFPQNMVHRKVYRGFNFWLLLTVADKFGSPFFLTFNQVKELNPAGFGERVADCCCGSGRILLAPARISRDSLFFGANIDRTCAMMCLINLCLNGLWGEVCWMDTLMNRFYGGWRIELHPEKVVPYIREITKEESYLVLRLPEKKEEIVQKQAVQQQLLFEFFGAEKLLFCSFKLRKSHSGFHYNIRRY